MNRIYAPFTKVFWQDLLDSSGGEKLVDMGLMSYSYLEAGIIEAIGPYVGKTDLIRVRRHN